MPRTTLLSRVEGLEIWTTVSESAQHFAVKLREGKLRVVDSLGAAEAMVAETLRHARRLRAH